MKYIIGLLNHVDLCSINFVFTSNKRGTHQIG